MSGTNVQMLWVVRMPKKIKLKSEPVFPSGKGYACICFWRVCPSMMSFSTGYWESFSLFVPHAAQQRREADASDEEGACYLQVGLSLTGVKFTVHGHLHQLGPGTSVRFTPAWLPWYSLPLIHQKWDNTYIADSWLKWEFYVANSSVM